MVNEAAVKSFLTVVRVGSFTEAARRLYLSQQAVSKHVAKLEQDLDCTLIRRDRGRLALTEAGEIYYKAFTQMETVLTQARQEAGKRSVGWSNTLVLGQPELLDLQQARRGVLRVFQSQNPQVQMVYRSAPSWRVLEWLEQGEIDAAFTFGNELQGRDWLEYVVIDQLREMLVVSADHPKATDSATYLDFREEPVFFTPVPEGGDTEFRLRMEAVGFPTDKLVATENMLSSCAAVEQGRGVNFLLECCRMLDSSSFRTYPNHQSITLVLACRRDSKKRAVRSLMEQARKQLKRS